MVNAVMAARKPSRYAKSIAATLFAILATTCARGYNVETHRAMTMQAEQLSVLGNLDLSILGALQCANGTKSCAAAVADIQGLLGQAAVDEDNNLRSFNHFFDPQNSQNPGAPLSTTLSAIDSSATAQLAASVACFIAPQLVEQPPIVLPPPCTLNGPASSKDWALAGLNQNLYVYQQPFLIQLTPRITPRSFVPYAPSPPTECGPDADADGTFVCDYGAAKAAYWRALTEPTTLARSQATTRLFFNLGHVLHHVQDMAQPQHVRNDMHCDVPVCAKLVSLGVQGLGSKSAYETYVDEFVPANISAFANLAAAGPQPLNKLPNPGFSIKGAFWSTADKRGMADFASDNFLSDGTMPTVEAGDIRLTAPPNAVLDVDLKHPMPKAFQQEMLSTQCLVPGHSAPLSAYYLTGSITDPEHSGPANHGYDQTAANAPLGVFSLAPKAGSTTPGQSIEWRVTGNCVTYDQAMFLLIPQAIRYSAWFIDFMFRGSTTLSASLAADGTLTISNNSSETVNTQGYGTFTLYQDDSSDLRSAVATCSASPVIAPNSMATCSLGSLPSAPPPSGTYLLVYQGSLGDEDIQVAYTNVQAPQTSAKYKFTALVTGSSGLYTGSQVGSVITGTLTVNLGANFGSASKNISNGIVGSSQFWELGYAGGPNFAGSFAFSCAGSAPIFSLTVSGVGFTFATAWYPDAYGCESLVEASIPPLNSSTNLSSTTLVENSCAANCTFESYSVMSLSVANSTCSVMKMSGLPDAQCIATQPSGTQLGTGGVIAADGNGFSGVNFVIIAFSEDD